MPDDVPGVLLSCDHVMQGKALVQHNHHYHVADIRATMLRAAAGWRTLWRAALSSHIAIGGAALVTGVACISSPYLLDSPLGQVTLASEHRFPLCSLYAWGSNKNKVGAPHLKDGVLQFPENMPALDGMALRDVNFSNDVGVAVDASGNIVQWGTGFDPTSPCPSQTITGLDIERVQISGSKVFALSRSGHVYVFATQRSKLMRDTSRWFSSPFDYIQLKATEKFKDIAAGEHHVLALSRNGHVYSVPADDLANEFGQLGYSSVSLTKRDSFKCVDARLEPKVVRNGRRPDATETPHTDMVDSSDIRYAPELRPVPSLHGVKFDQIDVGSNHSVARTAEGRVLTWGHNGFGQLGLGANISVDTVAVPSEVSWPVSIVGRTASCIRVAAGGNNTFFVIQSSNAPTLSDEKGAMPNDRVDVLAAGSGQRGTLGNGQRSQACGVPTRVKNVSGLYEYSERERRLSPIQVHALTVGASGQCALVLDAPPLSQDETRRDVYVWGNNDVSQLGMGGKGHTAVPALLMHTPPSSKDDKEPPALQRILLVERSKVRGSSWDGKERSFSRAEQRIVAGGSCVGVYTKV